MKNCLKRTLALVLVLVMVCGYVPATVFAAEAAPTLPTATVSKIRKADLTFALNFQADQVTDEQLEYYGKWYADFELTVNKDVTFDANGTAAGYLAGQYDGQWEDVWAGQWYYVPFSPVTLEANKPLKIMAFAAEMLGEPGLKYTYEEVYEVVKDFNCGVYFTPEFLEANPDLEVKLELRMYDPADEAKDYTIGQSHIFTIADVNSAPAMPTATAKEIEKEDLTFAMNFKADQVTDEQLEFYGNWYADFELTVNKDVTFDANGTADGWLSGQYDGHWENWHGEWLNVPFKPVTLKANEPLKIMAFAAETLGEPGLKYTYKEVYEVVKEFNCGTYFTPEFLVANPDLEVTLQLRMYNPVDESESYVVGDTYVFNNEIVAYNVQTGAVFNTVSAATNAAVSGQTVRLLKDTTDKKVYVLEGVTLDLNGYTLETQYLFCTHDLVDDSEANTGVLKVAKSLMMQPDNRQLPVKTADGYKFFEILGILDASTSNTTKDTVKYMFQPFFEAAAHEALLAGQVATGTTIRVRVTWTRADGTVADQDFTFPDSMVNTVLNSYRPATEDYKKMFTLELSGVSKFPGLTHQAYVVSDTSVEFTVGTQRVPTENQLTTEQVNLTNNAGATAVVPEGTKVAADAKTLTLQVTDLEKTNSNITLEEGEAQKSVDVHVEGVAADNTAPILVTVAGMAEAGLNDGNLKLYHVEKGVTNQMAQVLTLAEVDEHNEFYYDVTTGNVTMALATFSEITAVENENNPWDGTCDGNWIADPNVQVYEIFNANQLAQFGKLVDEGNTFAGKTVRLMMNVNLEGDGKAISFNPIGYGYAYAADGKPFCGVFDGNGNTINGLYQNCWDLGEETYTYSTAGGGLFASAKDATIKNLTMDNAEIVMECIDMGVVVGYAQGNCTFENIVVRNSKLANYQRYTGGAIGEVSNGHHILKNVDVEASTTVSSLWGDFDASLGGIIGGKWSHSYDDRMGQNGNKVSVYMENCDVAARLDAYNDVTSAYQWYSYRRCGMLIGNSEESKKTESGRTEATASYLEAKNCTVSYGDWAHYHYCEFTGTSSLDARYPWVRVEENLHGFNGAYSNPRYGNPIVGGEAINATNHGKDNTYGHNANDGHHVEIVLNQLYGGGQGCYGGNTHVEDGSVRVIDAPNAVEKFASKGTLTVQSNTTVTLGELFQAVANLPEDQKIQDAYVYAYVSPVSEDVTARATFNLKTAGTPWQEKTLAFTGTGAVTITVNDYFYCTPTTITVNVQLIKTDAVVTAAPVANELTYTGYAQALVSGGGAQGGKLVYSLTENGEFTQNVPTAINAGDYTVYYKVQGDATHNDSPVGSVQVTIAKAVASCTVTPTNSWTYDGTQQALVKTSYLKGASVVFSLTADGEFSETIPTTADAGTYTVYYKVLGNDNYVDSAVKYVTVTVHKAQSAVTVAPVVKQELTYNKEAQPLVDAGTATGGEIWYKVEKQQATRSLRATRTVEMDEDGFSPVIPTATNAGTYTVYYKVKGDDNHNDSEVSQVTVTVKKAKPVVVVPEVNASYGSKLEDVTLSDTTEGGTLAWNDDLSTSVGNAGTNSFTAIYTPEDTENYEIIKIEVSVNVEPIVKFATKFQNTDKQLYKIGNQNAVTLNNLFAAVDGVAVDDGNVAVTVDTVDGASGTYTAKATWTNGEIQFSGTGVVKVSITDGENCIPTELLLEVVDANNVTSVSGTIASNIVLLNDTGVNSLTVSGRNTVYGNGFTLTYTGNGQYLNNGLKQGVVTVSENGTLDNLRIEATIYPKAYLYYGSTVLGDYVQGGPSTVDGDKTRYHYQLSAVAASGNATISNCYIYGGRTNIFVNTGDVTVTDTVLESGTVANMQIQSNSSHTITLNNVTTIQKQINPTIGDTSLVMLGAGVLVGPDTTENPTIVLNGEFKQYNWVTADDAAAVDNTITQAIVNGALGATAYNHTVNGKTASNLGIVYMNTNPATVTNNTSLPYVLDEISMKMAGNTAKGQVCSLQGATGAQICSDIENADRSSVNGWYEPQFKYSADLGGQYIAEGGDEHCYREGDTILVMFPSGDIKELDLAKLVDITKYTGQNLNLQVTCKDSAGNNVTVTNGKILLSAIEEYTVTYTVTDTLFYDQDGKTVAIDPIEYSWDVALSVSLKDTAIPDARFEFDATKQKMGYYKPTLGDVKQYLPFLAGLKIYDYNGRTEYLRFDGSNDFAKVASITITGYESNKALVEIKLTDGGVIHTRFLARANSGGASTYTGSIKTKSNVIYFVNGGGTSNSASTTTSAYWYVDYYKFTGNNGVEITSAQQTFNSSGSSVSTPSGSFSTTIKYTVTYDANEGNCGQTVGYATSAAAAVTLPTPTRSGFMFIGWFTAASGGTRVGGAGDSYTPSANITLHAQWGKPSTVTYNANGGSCDKTSEAYTGTALTLPTPTRDGYWFTGWFDAAEGGNKIGDAGASYQATGDITLYAQWSPVYTVTYNANGGNVSPTSAQYKGTALSLPTPIREGYAFNGWYTAASGGTLIGKVGATYTPTANITLYAQWKDPVTVTYDATTNGGSCTTTSQTYLGTALTLPTPADRTGWTFNGWYTAASGGTKIGDAGASYTPTANITLYAQWTQIKYTITVTTSNANVSGVTNGQTACYGDTITFTVSYTETENQTVSVTASGKTVETTGSYTFTMPASNVTINASSTAPSSGGCVTADTLITLADGTQVRVDALTGNEELLVWNLETGMLDSASIMFVDCDPAVLSEIIHLYFSDGTEVKVLYEHGFWDYDLNRYVYLDNGAAQYIGHTFAKQDGDTLTKVVLTDVVLETEVTTAWSPVTAGHLCYFVNGMLSMPGGVGGLFNIFEVDPETMTYDYEAMARDIETYGLFTYEEVNAIAPLPLRMFEECGGAYLKISIAKGNMTVEDLAYMINRYRGFYK